MAPFFVSFAVSFVLVPVFTGLALNHTSPMKPELEEHSFKAGTPSSGSFAILISVLVSEIFCTSSPCMGTYALTAILFASVGITDDA
ncbi:MAG: hypothetical protein ACI4NM_09205, partial [Bullifex sp.]